MKYPYTAIIIEPRKHKALHYVLNNFTTMLDDKWQFIVFHGTTNTEFVKEIISKLNITPSKRIKAIQLPVEDLQNDDYNRLLYTRDFYKYIPTETFLIFQTDTFISEIYKSNINRFLKYDYVGAPWKHLQTVGNGGLSIRKKSKMLEILDKCSDRITYPFSNQLRNEDVFFSVVNRDIVNIYLPDFKEAHEFSVETLFSEKAFGVHNCWTHLKSDEIEKIKEYCPGLDKLIELHQK